MKYACPGGSILYLLFWTHVIICTLISCYALMCTYKMKRRHTHLRFVCKCTHTHKQEGSLKSTNRCQLSIDNAKKHVFHGSRPQWSHPLFHMQCGFPRHGLLYVYKQECKLLKLTRIRNLALVTLVYATSRTQCSNGYNLSQLCFLLYTTMQD